MFVFCPAVVVNNAEWSCVVHVQVDSLVDEYGKFDLIFIFNYSIYIMYLNSICVIKYEIAFYSMIIIKPMIFLSLK